MEGVSHVRCLNNVGVAELKVTTKCVVDDKHRGGLGADFVLEARKTLIQCLCQEKGECSHYLT